MNQNPLSDKLKLLKSGIYLPLEKTLIISDIHIGYEEAMNKQGILLPRIYFQHLSEKAKNLLKTYDITKVIINGDLKHEFGNISTTEWRQTLQFLDLFKKQEIIIIKGNHDTIIDPIAQKRNVTVATYYCIGDILVVHGDKELDIVKFEKEHNQKINTIIIGHEHPAITLRSENRSETFKCFLVGAYKKRTLIVAPSFNEVTEGTNVLREQILSPFLKKNLLSCEVYICGDEVYYFGELRNLRKTIS